MKKFDDKTIQALTRFLFESRRDLQLEPGHYSLDIQMTVSTTFMVLHNVIVSQIDVEAPQDSLTH